MLHEGYALLHGGLAFLHVKQPILKHLGLTDPLLEIYLSLLEPGQPARGRAQR